LKSSILNKLADPSVINEIDAYQSLSQDLNCDLYSKAVGLVIKWGKVWMLMNSPKGSAIFSQHNGEKHK